MSGLEAPLEGPDLTRGVDPADVADGVPLLGHADGEAVILVREGATFHAVRATCTHYGAPLAEGLVVDGTIRCPWHHAAFALSSGAMTRPPALADLACWKVEVRDGRAVITGRQPAGHAPDSPAIPLSQPEPAPAVTRAATRRSDGWSPHPESVLIVGGGAAGFAAALTLRREGYRGPVTMVTAERTAPVDRPNLSKDFLAGNAPAEWIPLRPDEWYDEQEITLLKDRRVMQLDLAKRQVVLSGGDSLSYGALLLATGADPIHLSLGDASRARYLRTLDDCQAIIGDAARSRSVIVIGASFIGLEVAASLRTRGLDVTVVAPETHPLQLVLGEAVGAFLKDVHESHGVRFRLGRTVRSADARGVVLDDGSRIDGDLVVAGVGVRPNTRIAEDAGLAVDKGVIVNERLETGIPGVFAAGDVARWPDPHTGVPVRVEHWVVAQRQGQVAARNMLGAGVRFDATPFFWSAHYDVTVSYVGHAGHPDQVQVDGEVAARDCTVRYFEGARLAATATIGRDRESLRAEVAMEHVLKREFAGRAP